MRTANEEAIIFQTTEDFTIPPARPIAYAVKRGGAVKDVGVAGGVAQAEGRRPARVRLAAEGRRRALHRLRRLAREHAARGRRRLLAGPRRRRRPRGSAAPLGGLGRRGGDAAGSRPRCVEDLTGGFNYGSGKVTIQLPDRHTAVPIAGHRALLGLLPPRHEDALRARRRRRATRTRRRSTRSRPRRSARSSPPRTRRARPGEVLGDERRNAGPDLRAPLLPDPRADARRSTSRCSTPTTGELGAVGAGRVVRREQADRPRTTCSTPPPARSSSARRSGRPTGAGASTAACRRRARRCA